MAPEEQEDEEQGDLPDETPVAAAGTDAARPKAPKRKRKKRMSMYDSTMHALGFTPAAIEHAAEVQLMTADGSPAGKVRRCLICDPLLQFRYLTDRISCFAGPGFDRDHAQERGGLPAGGTGPQRAQHAPGAAGP
jgi:hypothetical protein